MAGDTEATVMLSAALAGRAALAAAALATVPVAAALAGRAGIVAPLGNTMAVGAALSGRAAFAASEGATVPISAALAGMGTLTPPPAYVALAPKAPPPEPQKVTELRIVPPGPFLSHNGILPRRRG
jgi:hypothetical protein